MKTNLLAHSLAAAEYVCLYLPLECDFAMLLCDKDFCDVVLKD